MQFLLLQNSSVTSLPFVDAKGKKTMVSFPRISKKVLLKSSLLYQVGADGRDPEKVLVQSFRKAQDAGEKHSIC